VYRREEAQKKEVICVAHKAGSIILEAVNQGRLQLSHLQSAKSVAKEVNKLLKCEAVSGSQLVKAIKNGRVNQSPPSFGKTSEVPPDDFINMHAYSILLRQSNKPMLIQRG
jgi:hypothetical protein